MTDTSKTSKSRLRWLLPAVAVICVAVGAIAMITALTYRDTTISLKNVKPGDLIFVRLDYDTDSKSLAWLLPGDQPNHVGFITKDPKNEEQLAVLECWKHVRTTPIEDFLKRARGGKITIKRIPNLEPVKLSQAINWAFNKNGTLWDNSYDWLREYRYYNSEFIFKMLERSGIIPVPSAVPIASYVAGRKDKPRQLEALVPDDRLVVLVDKLFTYEQMPFELVAEGTAPLYETASGAPEKQ